MRASRAARLFLVVCSVLLGWLRSDEMPETLWVLTHADGTPIETYPTREQAEEGLRRVLVDEPDWDHLLTVEPFDVVEGDGAD